MRILVDLLHPAHVHVFRILIAELQANGDDVLVTARDKDVTLGLLNEYGIDHRVISAQATGSIGLVTEWVGRSAKLSRIAHDFKPDVMIGIMGVSIAPVGRLLRIPTLVFYDTEFATTTNRIVYPLAGAVITPDCYSAPVNGSHVTYPGYHELAYLHPDRFEPDPARVEAFGIDPQSTYSIIRFVSWEASHDRKEVALTLDQKRHLVDRLLLHGGVAISSESTLPADLRQYALSGPTSDVHHVLRYASVVVGESATMASEAAVLGTPAVYVATTSRGYVDDLERRYGLVRHIDPSEFGFAVSATEDALTPASQRSAEQAHQHLLTDKIDVTSWMIDYLDRFRVPI